VDCKDNSFWGGAYHNCLEIMYLLSFESWRNKDKLLLKSILNIEI
jgi:hypothetical protein